VTTVFEKRDIHELNKLYNIQYDLYRVPFDGGRGGVALPLKGASGNGMSNYFPRYSPDGKWVVYTRSRSGSMLQPDSELWIVPAGGGKARRMQCNRKIFNSWHSWSSNGRWLLFSSKANGPYTEIFLTHVDGEGNDTPPVLLSRFSDNGYAANVPEFVPLRTDAIRSIRVLGP
jgi:Tol biopolymer transport system component